MKEQRNKVLLKEIYIKLLNRSFNVSKSLLPTLSFFTFCVIFCACVCLLVSLCVSILSTIIEWRPVRYIGFAKAVSLRKSGFVLLALSFA